MPCTCTTNFEPARRLKIGPHPTGSRSGCTDRSKPIPPPFRQDRDVWMTGNRPRHAGTGNGLRRRCVIEGPSRERSALAAAAGGLTVHPQPMLFRSFDHLIRWLSASRLRPPSFTLSDQYRPFPLLIAGEVFLFLVIRRNPLPPSSPGTPPQFRAALDRA